MSEQTNLFFRNNQNLFSNNYLDHRLPETDLWKGQKDSAASIFEEISRVYDSIKSLNLGPGEEAELENKFIQPVLSSLGYIYHVQPRAKPGGKKKVPDYALFRDEDAYKTARKTKEIYSHCLTILEAKYWGRRLNDADKEDLLDSRDPTAQTVKYLDSVNYNTNGKINWAILTNGKLWRLFYFRASSRSGNYFEIDLEEIIKRNDPKAFLYFYLFFSKDAFLPDPVSGSTWLDIHLKGAEDYAARVSTKLKDRIFDQVFEGLATGFIHFRHSDLGITQETEESRREIFKGCLTLLYRLLFILYAESRTLLPVHEDGYDKVSLSRLKRDIYQDLRTTGLDKMSMRSSVYWARIQSLFEVIAKGDPVLNVPVYNGGLFETFPGGFLARHKMPDRFFADAIEQLTVDHEGDYKPDMVPFIDYSSLNVRHLGDIYEGLLEFHIRVAEEDIAEIKEKGKSVWKKLSSEVKAGTKTQRLKKTGEVYIENSKHERKATGSYYTPHYIVEYIVKNTVGPVLEERLKTAEDLMSQITTASKAQKKQATDGGIAVMRNQLDTLERTLFETIFDIKVLDPAMGSGHFLVHAVDYITDKIVTFLADHPENPVIRKIEELRDEIVGNVTAQGVKIDESKLTEVNLIKRMVLKRCIYGVDLNEMAVELAKLSLWLDSFTLGAPLSFLDHHLKCGNSLVGLTQISDILVQKLSDLADDKFHFYETEAFSKVQLALSFATQISELTDATISEAKKSYDLYSQGQKAIDPIRRRFNVATAKYFMDMGDSISRIDQLAATLDFDKEQYAEIVEKCKRALQIAEEKKFFHWRLEFPEVFYTEKAEKEIPGFDCVISNPPYIDIKGLDKELSRYLFKVYNTARLRINIFASFFEQSLNIFQGQSGNVGFIIPTALLTQDSYAVLRKKILTEYWLSSVVRLPNESFGESTGDVKVDTCIVIVRQHHDAQNPKSSVLVYDNFKRTQAISYDTASHAMEIEQKRWLESESSAITITSKEEDSVVRKIQVNSAPLENFCEFCLGLTPYDKYAGHSEEEIEKRIFNSHEQVDSNYKKLLVSGDVHRYDVQWNQTEWIKYGPWLAAPREQRFFTEERILVQQIIDWSSLRILSGWTDKELYNTQNQFNLLACGGTNLKYIISILNSRIISYYHRKTFLDIALQRFQKILIKDAKKLPIPKIAFTSHEKKRRARVTEAIELYKNYMVELEQKGISYEKTDASAEHDRSVGGPVAGGKKGKISGEHPGAGTRVHGVRGRTRKPQDAEGVHEESEEYEPSPRSTRFIESTLGIKSYSELAPHLAKEVARVMVSLLEKSPDELKITPEFICELHKDAFEGLFPSWAGRYRDRNVKVGDYEPPPYFEVPVLMRTYCDDLEFRLSSHGTKPTLPEPLIEAFAFAEGRLLSIHPFRDFNGRVTRMLLFALIGRFDLPPVQLVPEEDDRVGMEAYLNALAEADRMNWQPLMTIWRKRFGLEEGK